MIQKRNESIPNDLIELQKSLNTILVEYCQADKTSCTNEIKKSFLIGGGVLSNHFIQEMHGIHAPSKDIDIFAPEDLPEEFYAFLGERLGISLEIDQDWVHLSYGGSFQTPFLVKGVYEGRNLEFIPCDQDRVFDFDFRFRMIYLYEGHLFAQEKAFEDIREKRLVLMNPVSPFSTLLRLHRFERELGFKADEISRNYLEWYIRLSCPSAKDFLTFLEKRKGVAKEIQDELTFWAVSNTDEKGFLSPSGPYPFHPDTETILYSRIAESPLMALHYDALLSYQPFDVTSFELDIVEEGVVSIHLENHYARLKEIYDDNTLRGDLTLSFDMEAIVPDRLFHHRHDLINNPTVTTFVDRYQGLDQTRYTNPLPKRVSAEIEPIGKNYGDSFGEMIRHQVIRVTLDEGVNLHFRLCTNGRYTLSGFDQQADAQFYAEAIARSLDKAVPWMELFNPDLVGVRSYRSGHVFSPFFTDIYDRFLLSDLNYPKTVPFWEKFAERLRQSNEQKNLSR